jgi:hypothetical protein
MNFGTHLLPKNIIVIFWLSETCPIIIPYIVFFSFKIFRQFRCFTENLLTRETTRRTTQTYNVEGDNRLSPGLQP